MNRGKIGQFYLLSLILAFGFGCATSPPKEKKEKDVFFPPATAAEEKKDPINEFAEQRRLKAREQEKTGDLEKSLRSWEVVAGLLPADSEAKEEVAALRNRLSAIANRHFQKGVAHYQNSALPLARKEFLLALYSNPDHAEALDYLKSKLPGEDVRLHAVKKSETLRSIAQETYQDPKKDFLIAYFNDLEPNAKIEPPLMLRLPIEDSARVKKGAAAAKPPSGAKHESGGKNDKARGPSAASPCLGLVASTGKNPDPSPMSRDSLNVSYYESGKQLSREKKFQEALDAFCRVDLGYKDVRLQIARSKKELAVSHYINGVKYFTEEEIEKAIEEWETALALDPHHPKAGKDIETARLLLQKLEKIQ